MRSMVMKFVKGRCFLTACALLLVMGVSSSCKTCNCPAYTRHPGAGALHARLVQGIGECPGDGKAHPARENSKDAGYKTAIYNIMVYMEPAPPLI